jgi:tetratricopeptide (TPR) repeat protein
MRLSLSLDRLLLAGRGPSVVVAAALAALVGCGGGAAGQGAGARHAEGAGGSAMVSDEAFATSVHDLLLAEPGSPARASLLAGVTSRQMDRAVARFKAQAGEAGHERALVSVLGALYLVHTGELADTTLGPAGRAALLEASRLFASRGDEGRARAAYEILLRISSGADKASVQAHLDALRSWTRDEITAGPPAVAAGEIENAAVSRRLLEPSEAALDEATKATLAWIDRAIELQTQYRDRHVRPSREEIAEAVRALQSGGTVLAAIYLKDGDATGALRAVGRAPSRDLVRAELGTALEAVKAKPDASRWIELLHALTPNPRDREHEDEEALEDRELLRAATFGIACQAYRADPTQPEGAAIIAAVLQDLGMAEASPAIILEATKAHPDARTVSGAIAITMRAMNAELEADDADGVRRTFVAAAPLLAIASRKDLAGQLQPGGARVRAMMGEIELQQGRLDVARKLLVESATEEKSGGVMLALARIDRHDDKTHDALEDLRDSLSAPDTEKDPALRGEVLLMISDLTRENGDVSAAKKPLSDAVKELARARTTSDADDRARVERVLSRVLDRFGATQRAQQALERAIEATPHDKHQIAATLGQLVARAYVRGDLVAARDGLSRAQAAELDPDDLVYYALWVRLLERQLQKPTDGAPARVFASNVDDGRWTGRLAAFGAGKIKPEALIASAKTPTQKTEALFYAAMDRRAAGDAKGLDSALKEVLAASGVDLMEVGIAREILTGQRSQIGGPLPADVALP